MMLKNLKLPLPVAPQSGDPAQPVRVKFVELVKEEPDFRVIDQSLVDWLAPAHVEISEDYINVSGTYFTFLYIADFPFNLSRLLWQKLLGSSMSVYVSLHYQHVSSAIASKLLEREANALRTTRNLQILQKRDPNDSDLIRLARITDARARTDIRGEPIFLLTAVIGVSAPNLEQLREDVDQIIRGLRDANINSVYTARFEQLRAFNSVLPIGVNQMGAHRRNVFSDTVSRMFPMLPEERVKQNGLFYGLDVQNNAALFVDPFSLENPNSIILGVPGAGKSFFMKDLIEQVVLKGGRAFVIDIEGEYYHLAKDLGGAYLNMGGGSEYVINVLDLPVEDQDPMTAGYQDFRAWVQTLVETHNMRGESARLDQFQNEVLDKAYQMAFAKCGIYRDRPETYHRTPPVLGDVYEALADIARKERIGNTFLQRAAQSLHSALYSYVEGSFAAQYNRQSNINVAKLPLVVFGLKGLDKDKQELAVRIRQIQIWTWGQILKDIKTPKYEIVDEAWFLLEKETVAEDLASRARRFRKKHASLWIATQHVEDFAANRHAAAIFSIAATRLYFKHSPTGADLIAQVGKLTEAEKEIVKTLNHTRGECLIHVGPIRRIVYKPVPQSRYRLYTTKPSEMLEM